MAGRSSRGGTTSAGDLASAATGSSAGGADEAASTQELDGVKQARLVAHLQDKLPPIEFRDVPLGQFLAFLSEFSTVPITIDANRCCSRQRREDQDHGQTRGETVEAALRAALPSPG